MMAKNRASYSSGSGIKGAAVRFCRNYAALIALCIFIFVVLACWFGPYVWKASCIEIDLHNMRARPTLKHPFGTDVLGRDVLARMMKGGQLTLTIMFQATVLAAVFGSILGICAGYFGGNADFFIMRFMDMVSAVPSILLALMIEIAFNYGSLNFRYGVAISSMPAFARILRASVMNIMGSEYIEASRALGANGGHIVRRHIMHNIASPLIIQTMTCAAETLLTCTVMGYLEIGVQPPTPEWGGIVYSVKDLIRSYPATALIPSGVIVLCEMCLHFIGNGLRDALDPQG